MPFERRELAEGKAEGSNENEGEEDPATGTCRGHFEQAMGAEKDQMKAKNAGGFAAW